VSCAFSKHRPEAVHEDTEEYHSASEETDESDMVTLAPAFHLPLLASAEGHHHQPHKRRIVCTNVSSACVICFFLSSAHAWCAVRCRARLGALYLPTAAIRDGLGCGGSRKPQKAAYSGLDTIPSRQRHFFYSPKSKHSKARIHHPAATGDL